MGSGEPPLTTLFQAPAPKTPQVRQRPPSASGIVTCHQGCPDTVADLGTQGGKQQGHGGTPGAARTAQTSQAITIE